jgi:basic membrane lipoprotein Med (substrate-binding protein (PBP1-ABC) superfamily)
MIRVPGISTVFFAVFFLSACSGGGGSGSGSGEESFRVALLTPGPISDKSWNAGAYAGLMAIRDSMGAAVSHIQTRTPAEFDENFRQYGAKGFDLVFGHGFEFQDAALRVAPSYPNTVYITTSGTSVARNVGGAEFAFEESSYLAGMVAGAMTTSNVIGIIGGTELPPVKRSFAAFQQGARRTNPRVRFLLSYIGNWDDVSAGKEQAIAQISRGADVIFQNADAAGLGVFQAVKEARGVLAIGSNSNQNDIVPESTIGSVVIDLPKALLLIAREVKADNFSGRVFRLGLDGDVVTFVPNPALASRIPPGVTAAVDSVAEQMMNRTFTELLPDSMRRESGR